MGGGLALKPAEGRVEMMRFAPMVAVVVVTMALSPLVWAQDRPWGWGMHPMWGLWGAWGLGMLFVMLTFWVVVIAALVLAVRWLVGQGREPRRDQALEMLRERYAKGEIGKDEFDAKKRDLT
jgi:putative membrane protein